jgi:archaemetzincin
MGSLTCWDRFPSPASDGEGNKGKGDGMERPHLKIFIRVSLFCFGFILVTGPCTFAATQLRKPDDKGDNAWVEEAKLKVYASISPEDEKGFRRLGPPKLGEWLHHYKETPQTLERYKLASRVRPTAERRTIVLQPLGEMDDEKKKILELMREYAEIFFQLPARVAPPIGLKQKDDQNPLYRVLPAGNRHGRYDRQYDGDKIMTDLLMPKIPDDAAIYLGITMEDLFSGNTNYVFGVGSLQKRVGVYSLCRYFPEFWGVTRADGDYVQGLRRSCKVLNHEAGHMFGITHCVFYRCSMNGSNTMAETDAAPIHFCPLCHRKLAWNLDFDSLKRYDALQKFYEKHELKPEAEWIAERLTRWKKILQTEAASKVDHE